jgi:outer membrane murein-binding lipoprotein Lpp
MGLLLVIGGWSLAEVRSIKADLGAKIAQLDTKVAALQTKVEAAARTAQQPPRRGPDPDKVYTVKTEGAPTKGSSNAVVTIAEFSDFQ